MTDDREHPGEGETAVVPLAVVQELVGWLQSDMIPAGRQYRARRLWQTLLAAPALHPGATGESVVAKEDLKCTGECASAERGLRSTADPCVCRPAAPVAPPSQPGAGGEEVLLVPADPTEAMFIAARNADTNSHELLYSDFGAIYRAMIGAAPAALTPSPSSGDRAEGSAEAMRAEVLRLIDKFVTWADEAADRSADKTGPARAWARAVESLRHQVEFIALPARNEAAALASSGGGEVAVTDAMVEASARAHHDANFNVAMFPWETYTDKDPYRQHLIKGTRAALTAALSPTPPVAASEDVRRVIKAASFVMAGWQAGRIKGCDEGEDVPEGDMALGALADALRALTPPGAGQRSAEGEGK